MLLSDAISQYEQHLRAKRRSPKTLAWYKEQFAAYTTWQLLRIFRTADELPEAELLTCSLPPNTPLASPLPPCTPAIEPCAPCSAFSKHRRKLTHDQNPIHLVEAPTVPDEIRRHVTVEDLQPHLLLRASTRQAWLDHRNRLILLILFYSGLRLAELCALHPGASNDSALEMTVHRRQGDKARVVPCAPEVRPTLAAYLYTPANHAEALLLASDGYGEAKGALRAEGVRQMLIRRCKAVGINPPYSPHAFRHGFRDVAAQRRGEGDHSSDGNGPFRPASNACHLRSHHRRTVRREYDEALAKRVKRAD